MDNIKMVSNKMKRMECLILNIEMEIKTLGEKLIETRLELVSLKNLKGYLLRDELKTIKNFN